MRHWTPHDILVFIHHSTSTGEWQYGWTGPYKDSLAKLEDAGLLAWDRTSGGKYKTAAGDAFMQLLLSTPVPAPRYVDPRTTELIEDWRL